MTSPSNQTPAARPPLERTGQPGEANPPKPSPAPIIPYPWQVRAEKWWRA